MTLLDKVIFKGTQISKLPKLNSHLQLRLHDLGGGGEVSNYNFRTKDLLCMFTGLHNVVKILLLLLKKKSKKNTLFQLLLM